MHENLKVIAVKDLTTKTNKPFKGLEVVDEKGNLHKVSIFSDFPDFANIKQDYIIRGKLEKNDKGYLNLISETQAPKSNAGAFKTAQIEKTMERKEQSISRFQDDKEWSIMVSSTMRDAVSLAIAEVKDIRTLNTLEADILKWRQWLIENWSVNKTDKPPF